MGKKDLHPEVNTDTPEAPKPPNVDPPADLDHDASNWDPRVFEIQTALRGPFGNNLPAGRYLNSLLRQSKTPQEIVSAYKSYVDGFFKGDAYAAFGYMHDGGQAVFLLLTKGTPIQLDPETVRETAHLEAGASVASEVFGRLTAAGLTPSQIALRLEQLIRG